MASLNTYSLTVTTLLALSLITVSPATTKPAVMSTTSKDQVECTMCDSCENPCQPFNPPPPPPPEIICPPPAPLPPKQPECPPPPAPPTCSDCSPQATVGPYTHPPPQTGVIGGAVYSPPYGGVNPYFPYTPYKSPPSDQSAGSYQFRCSPVALLLSLWLASSCFI